MNNLDNIKTDAEQYIDPLGAPGSILAENNQQIVKDILTNTGKYVGAPFKAHKQLSIFPAGSMSWESKSLNTTTLFQIKTSKLTSDLNDFGLVLGTLQIGDLLRFKDFKGRSVFLLFNSFSAGVDLNGNDFYLIEVQGYVENINYTYQEIEVLDCVFEVFQQKATSPTNTSDLINDGESGDPFLSDQDVVPIALNGLSVRDSNDLEHFVSFEYIQFKGGVFSATNKRFEVTALRDFTAFVDVVTGNDATSELNNPLKPYKTVAQVYLEIPDNEFWTVYFLDSSIRQIDFPPANKRVRFETLNTGTMDLSIWGISSIYKLEFYCPNSDISHVSTNECTITSSIIGEIVCRDIFFDVPRRTISNNTFQFQCNVSARNITARNTPRSILESGTIKCNTYDTSQASMFYTSSSSMKHEVDNLILNGQTFLINGSSGKTSKVDINSITGSGTFNTIDLLTFNVSNISSSATITIRIDKKSSLTGLSSVGFLASILIDHKGGFKIFDFYGSINLIDSSSGFNTTNVVIKNSTIFIENELFFAWYGQTLATRIWNVSNVEIIQTNNVEIFKNVSPNALIEIRKTGFFKSNQSNLGSNVSVVDRTINSF